MSEWETWETNIEAFYIVESDDTVTVALCTEENIVF